MDVNGTHHDLCGLLGERAPCAAVRGTSDRAGGRAGARGTRRGECAGLGGGVRWCWWLAPGWDV